MTLTSKNTNQATIALSPTQKELTILAWKNTSALTDLHTDYVHGMQTDDFSMRSQSLGLWLKDYLAKNPKHQEKLADYLIKTQQVPYGIEFTNPELEKKAQQQLIKFADFSDAEDLRNAIQHGEFKFMDGIGCPTIEQFAYWSGLHLKAQTGKHRGKPVDSGYIVLDLEETI